MVEQKSGLIAVPDVRLIPVEIFPSNLSLSVLEENSAFEEGTVSNGYGRSTSVAIEIGKDITVDLNIDINLKTISEERFQEWQTEAFSFVSEEQKQFLDERWGGSGSAGGLFGGFFGVVFANGDAYRYKDQANSSFKATQDFQKGFAKSVYNLESADFRVTGSIKATGTSRIPTRVKVFFQLTTIVFSDNRKLTVVDTDNPIAADADSGDTRRVITTPGSKLKILPIDP